MNKELVSYSINEGSFSVLKPQEDRTVNILRYMDEANNSYNIFINRATLGKEQTVDDFCEQQYIKMKHNIPGFEIEGKNLKHEIGPAKLPVLQTAHKFLDNGNWVRQVSSIISLPYHPKINPNSDNLLIFTLATNNEFTETQRKHYVRIINSFIPSESVLGTEN